MDLKSYFNQTNGLGILSTANYDGQVDAAIYSRPHVMDDGTVAFIMRNRLTRHNLQTNPHAAYLFKEEGSGYKGKRLFLTMIKEEKESSRLYELRRRSYPPEKDRREAKYLAFFSVDKTLPLIGPGTSDARMKTYADESTLS
ncbi:MAG: pyridoxamine 5'-phosphate oxidase family protein [Desulfobacteraceae bacterium]|jgi:hypothetical protein